MEVAKAGGITPAQIETLAQAGVIPSGTPAAQVEVFAESCRQHGLSPFKKEIYLVAYNTKNGTQYHTIVGIDGLQQKAARTGRFAGVDEEQYNRDSNGGYKTAAELKAAKELPISCTVTVQLIGNSFAAFNSAAVLYVPSDCSLNRSMSTPANLPVRAAFCCRPSIPTMVWYCVPFLVL